MSKQAGSGELVDELNYSVSARSVVDQSWLAYETHMPGLFRYKAAPPRGKTR
jgi:hypothetical protein